MRRFFGNRRNAFRYPLVGTAELYLSGRELILTGVLIDISKTGVSFMVTKNSPRLSKDEVGMLTLNSPDLPDLVTCFVGLARHVPAVEGVKLGWDFMSIDDENYTKVTAYLALAKVRAERVNVATLAVPAESSAP